MYTLPMTENNELGSYLQQRKQNVTKKTNNYAKFIN